MRKKRTMQPEEIPTAEPAAITLETRFDWALEALTTAHSQVQVILAETLGSPNTAIERALVSQLAMVRGDLWSAIKRLAGADPRAVIIGRDDK